MFTLNLDHIIKLRRDSSFRAAYRNARHVTADGFPIVWAGRLGGMRPDRVTGADLIEPLCDAAARSGLPIFLFGSTFESLRRTASYLAKRHPGLEIAGVASPEWGFDPKSKSAVEYSRMIAQSGAGICFVGLGAPKQEIFTETAIAGSAAGLAFVCIGAGLDFLSRNQIRAPRWVRAAGAEWLWRLLSDPKRFGRRYLDCLLVLPSVLLASVTHRGAASQL